MHFLQLSSNHQILSPRLLPTNLIALPRNTLLSLLRQDDSTLRPPIILLSSVLLQNIQTHDIQRVVMCSLKLDLGNVVNARIDSRFPGVDVSAQSCALFDSGLAQVGALLLRPVEEGRCEVQSERHLAGAHAGAVAGNDGSAGCGVLVERGVEDWMVLMLMLVMWEFTLSQA